MKIRHRLASYFALAASFLGTLSAFSQTRVPGTPVVITPPKGLELSDQFPGFINAETNSSLVVTVLNGAPFDAVTEGFSDPDDPRVKEQKITILENNEVEISGKKAKLIRMNQEALGQTVEKWGAFIDNSDGVIIVIGNGMEEDNNQFLSELKEGLMTLKLEEGSEVDPKENFKFSLDPVFPFQESNVLGHSIVYGLTDGPVAENPDDPMFIIAQSFTEDVDLEEGTAAFARSRFKQLDNLTGHEILSTEAVNLAGLDGTLLKGKGKSTTEVDTSVELAILDTKDGYFILIGQCPTENYANWSFIFEEMRGQFKLK